MHIFSSYPASRPRRLRRTNWIRDLVQETHFTARQLIWPIFLREPDTSELVASMPGIKRWLIEELPNMADQALALGIPAVALFPCVPLTRKSLSADEAFRTDNLVGQAIQAIKKHTPELGIITDVALDPYTSHGHDGLLTKGGELVTDLSEISTQAQFPSQTPLEIDNDLTVAALVRQALALGHAGTDIIAPSDMMDGRIGAIRTALDTAGLNHVSILAYSAKYASAFYGPFRDAVVSKQSLSGASKKTYQMNPANIAEAIREVALDIQEGADMVMVKPALPYLDVIRAVKENFSVPTFAYHVSGEYAMIKAAEKLGWLDGKACMLESLLAIRRAGAQAILTYAAVEVAQWLREGE